MSILFALIRCRRPMNKRANISVISLAISAIFVLLACQPKVAGSEETANTAPPQTEAAPKNNEPITIAAVGDVTMGSPYPNDSRMPPNDGADLLKGVTPILSAADIAFGNLEGLIVDGGVSGKYGGTPYFGTALFARKGQAVGTGSIQKARGV